MTSERRVRKSPALLSARAFLIPPREAPGAQGALDTELTGGSFQGRQHGGGLPVERLGESAPQLVYVDHAFILTDNDPETPLHCSAARPWWEAGNL